MAAAENVTPIEKEAADEGFSFEFAGATWYLVEDFNILDFQEFMETQRFIGGLRYALGDEYDSFKAMAGVDVASMQDAIEALVASVGLGGPGESRASRRSSARRRPARR